MKNLLFLALSTLTLATACKKKDETATPAPMQVSGTLDATQSVPAVPSSPGSGKVTGTYDPGSKTLNYTLTYSGITPTSGHLHFGAPGHTNSYHVVTFSNLTSPITGSATLTPMEADSLLTGHIYANLHTQAYTTGEIRANLTAK